MLLTRSGWRGKGGGVEGECSNEYGWRNKHFPIKRYIRIYLISLDWHSIKIVRYIAQFLILVPLHSLSHWPERNGLLHSFRFLSVSVVEPLHTMHMCAQWNVTYIHPIFFFFLLMLNISHRLIVDEYIGRVYNVFRKNNIQLDGALPTR